MLDGLDHPLTKSPALRRHPAPSKQSIETPDTGRFKIIAQFHLLKAAAGVYPLNDQLKISAPCR
ncbi:hypothetical protein [Rhizobium leguminosarum]|uniref:hypothetical protein n=1 Tax=Rhizobium leguminosarum TaxID=384 RepID=UPI0012BCAE3D|nr:hypothetical protein [Rhizobium leguminosarum]